jgi:flagellar basal-body rod protein FlgG
MNGGFYIGAIGLGAQQRALDVIANNIANLNTAGFKRSGVQFSELLAPAADGTTDRAGALSGVSFDATSRVWSEGALKPTGAPMDVAIDGSGFLEVMGPSGHSLLWRGGTLKVNDDGTLATSDGLPLSEMISVPQAATQLAIAPDGTISAMVDGKSEQIGQLDLVLAKDPDTLTEFGDGYYEAADTTETLSLRPGEEGGGTLLQGTIEAGNVQLTDEMTSLLLVQRAYAANAQVVQVADQLMSIVNGLRR